jgi:hypothetical protein
MKSLTSSMAFALVFCGAAALNAQTKPSDNKGKDMKPMMVTGCVMESGGHYMLDHAMMSVDGTKSPSPSMSKDTMSYKLMGGDLKALVGQKVEITGMISKDPMPKDPKDKASADKTMMGGTLDVKSVKMISPSCS